MNEKKICFIMCVNDEVYEKEQLKYIQELKIPTGYEIEIFSIWEATSMTSGYNEAMHASDAKYKVYMHQDAFIVEPYFIEKMLAVFREKEIGMLGVVGSPSLPENAIMWNGKRTGGLYYNCRYGTSESQFGNIEGAYQDVEAVDGLLMATQYDLPWREDLFDGWDFYDVSQSAEFSRRGYRVVVPKQKHPWCIHDDGFLGVKNYYRYREIFLKEYKGKTNLCRYKK